MAHGYHGWPEDSSLEESGGAPKKGLAENSARRGYLFEHTLASWCRPRN